MKKKLLILFTLVMVLSIALTLTSLCFAEEESVETIAEQDTTQEVVEENADNSAKIWFMETWDKCKNWVIGACSGISFSAIVAAIFLVGVRRATNSGFDKIEKSTNSQTIADLSSAKILDNLSNVALDVNIKPVLESQYKAISEEINGELTINLQKQDKKNLAIIECFEAFADYFKCSNAVSDEQKQNLAEKIASAKSLYSNVDNKVSAKVEIKADTKPVKETKIEIAENY